MKTILIFSDKLLAQDSAPAISRLLFTLARRAEKESNEL